MPKNDSFHCLGVCLFFTVEKASVCSLKDLEAPPSDFCSLVQPPSGKGHRLLTARHVNPQHLQFKVLVWKAI